MHKCPHNLNFEDEDTQSLPSSRQGPLFYNAFITFCRQLTFILPLYPMLGTGCISLRFFGLQALEGAAGSIWQHTDTYVAVADYVNAIRKQRQPLTTPQEAAHISPEDLRQIRVV